MISSKEDRRDLIENEAALIVIDVQPSPLIEKRSVRSPICRTMTNAWCACGSRSAQEG